MRETIEFLLNLADTLDKWAEQSIAGSWSSHQVDANRREADKCRREAARLRRLMRES